jgi:hypothetical protein
MTDFFPGQRVACIDGHFHPTVWEWVNEVPMEGSIYTIRRVMTNNRHAVTGKVGPGVSLVEIPGRIGQSREVFWVMERFRPLDLEDYSSAAKRAKSRAGKARIPAPTRRTKQPATAPA